MENNSLINAFQKFSLSFTAISIAVCSFSYAADAQIDMRKRPSLVITNDRAASTGASAPTGMPASSPLRPVQAPSVSYDSPMDIKPADIGGSSYYQPTQTVVGKKVEELKSDLNSLKSKVSGLSSQLRTVQDRNRTMSAEYNASIATINTQLQGGTTPGNPRLVEKLNTAQGNLDRLNQSVADLNGMAVEAANAASMGSYLLDSVRAAYGLSGAVEEDHAALSQVEDEVNSAMVTTDRVLNDINDDITRTAAYLSAERSNLRTLSLAVSSGDYFGRSLSGRPFSGLASSGGNSGFQQASLTPGPAPVSSSMMPMPGGASSSPSATPLTSPRPLVKIRFDKPNVNYEQAVYTAVNEAMQKYPNARFELIAVNPTGGNAAQVAIESTRARRNAETVLRSLTQMGVDPGKIDLSTQQSAEARSNEVHIFIR